MSSVVDNFGNASSLQVNAATGELMVSSNAITAESVGKSLYFPSADGGVNTSGNGVSISASQTGNKRHFYYFPNNNASTIDTFVEFPNSTRINVTINVLKSGTQQNNVPSLDAVVMGWNEQPTAGLFDNKFWQRASLVEESSVEQVTTGSKMGAYNMRKIARIKQSSGHAPWGDGSNSGVPTSADAVNSAALYMWSKTFDITHRYIAVSVGNDSGDTTSGDINNVNCVISSVN